MFSWKLSKCANENSDVFSFRKRSYTVCCSAASGLQLPGVIVQNADRAGEAELTRPLAYRESILRISYARAQNGVDGDAELGMLSQPLKLPVQNLQASFRDLVRCTIVDADLQVVQSGTDSTVRCVPASKAVHL